MNEYIILVDKNDREIGVGEKIQIHREGKLHRAFSIIIFSTDKKKMLLQQRAKTKYHCGGLWSNACCGHPRSHEILKQATKRRLGEEMGMKCQMQELFSFIYKSKLDHELSEYEFDHVFIGHTDKNPIINSEEADDYKWTSLRKLKVDIRDHPRIYTPWFKIILKELAKKRII